jgi:cyclopropane fatty-acyl-phospholipid synthase-like methyltransferase
MPSRVEIELNRRFRERYLVEAAVAIELERAVLGSDYGANGYATTAQATTLANALGLRPGLRLLDVGSGCGFPGLCLAAKTGCSVVMTDIPIEGMRRARRRSLKDGLARRSSAVVATARHLPFRWETFDAIVHTDVLC